METKTDTTFKRPRLRYQRSAFWLRWLDRWPIAAWAGVAVIAMFFYVKSTQYGVLSGSALTIKQNLSPVATARVKAVSARAKAS